MRAKNLLLVSAAFATGFYLTKLGKSKEINPAHLIEEAIYKGFAEIKNSKVAVEKSNSTNIKIFAQRMIDDHAVINQKLADIAQAKGIATPDIDQNPHRIEPYLAYYRGDDSFDDDYVDHQLKVHKDTIKLFLKMGIAGDPDLREFASQTAEQLRHHLRMAQDLADNFHTNNIPTSSPYQADFVEEPNYKV